MGFRHRAVVFRCRGVVGRICPRRNAPHGESLPTRRTGERICPARERSPRRKPPDTAHGRKDLPRAGTLPSAKAYRHGAPAKEFAPRRSAPRGEGLPTRHEGERICPRAGTLSSAKASRHGARAKRFAPRRNTPLEGLPTRREGERICPHENALLGESIPTRRTSEKICPTRGSRSPHGPTNGGPSSVDGQPEKHPFGGVAPTACGRCRVHSPKKIRLLHETHLFYGESHVGSPHLFPSFPSVGRCVARERNPVPPVAPHRGSEPRGLRRTGEMVRRFDAMCPCGGEWLPRGGNGWPCGGRCYPGIRCFGERFHRRRCANPDACRGRRCARAHDDLGQRAFRYFRPTFRNPLCDKGKTCGGRRCARG